MKFKENLILVCRRLRGNGALPRRASRRTVMGGLAFITGAAPANLLPRNDHLSHLHTLTDEAEDAMTKMKEAGGTGLFSSPTKIKGALGSMQAISQGIEKLGNWAPESMPVTGSWWAGLAVGLTADQVLDYAFAANASFAASHASAAIPTTAATVVVSNFTTAYPTITATTSAATITVTSRFAQVVRPKH